MQAGDKGLGTFKRHDAVLPVKSRAVIAHRAPTWRPGCLLKIKYVILWCCL
ncbi:hypothetical protein DVDV_0332 [Desulfovibrio sp. DV]|nr:hypothetical protein DVDV_0332 [Desulfovibrio sp. DV]